jgi:hypothetical protein
MAIKNGASSTTHDDAEDERWRHMRRFPHWDEIELRLRHRWSPRRVAAWHAKTYSVDPVPSWRTLYRFVNDKPESWFISTLLAQELATAALPRILVLEEQAAVIEAMKKRVARGLQTELDVAKGGMGLLMPEVRASLDLLWRALREHLQTQQELGMEPKLVGIGGNPLKPGEGPGGPSSTEGFAVLVERMIALPTEEFVPTLRSLFGPPRGDVIEGEAHVVTTEEAR